jgi:PAS domain S-box-containing protein
LGAVEVRPSRAIAACGFFLVALRPLFVVFPGSFPVDFLAMLTDAVLGLLVVFSAWRASRRSGPYARVFWLCAGFGAVIWALSYGTGALALMSGRFNTALSARWPSVVLGSFPFCLAFTLPLLLNEERERPEIGWLQAIDISQFGIIVFTAFLVFFYIPSLHILSDVDRLRYLRGLHLMRDSFLAAAYLYRGWRSHAPDLRRLHFRIAGFFVLYGVPALILPMMNGLAWQSPIAGVIFDLAPLGLLLVAEAWKQESLVPVPDAPRDQGMLWTQGLAAIMPISVVALAARMPEPYLRTAWVMVTVSFVCYAARLLLMQRRQAATLARLAASEERFSKAFKSSPAAITISRLSDCKYLDVNDRWLELMNVTREGAIGRTCQELGVFASADEWKKWKTLTGALGKHGSLRAVNLKVRSGGRVLDTLAFAEVIELEGEPLLLTSFLDVTEFKSVIEQLHHAQKMELVGSLAGGVAHDFNNLLTIITGYSALAQKRELPSDLAEEIAQIKEAAGKAAALIRQLLAFSRRQVLEPRNINLNGVITEIERLLRRTIGENITLRTLLSADLGTVHADPVQIEQVVMNLAVNARDAMPNGGRLLFETSNLDLSSPYPQNGFEIPPGRYVVLAIADTGTGIQPEHLARIFEPFFTTKGVGRGTGLGLSTVYGIVSQSGGYIWANSHVGVGTTFKVCLPRVGSAAATTRTAVAGQDLRGTETVLVVDDDRSLCELTAKILGHYGYRVITSHSGEDALRKADEFGAEIDLLVTDVILEKMSGWELARLLKAKRPQLKLLYVSGYSHFSLSSENLPDSSEMTLRKPFAPHDLGSQARKVLGPSKVTSNALETGHEHL